MNKICRLWVASPDYMGGAVQEITDYSFSPGVLRFTLPALQFWTMIVVEPESTDPDALVHIPADQNVTPTTYTLSGRVTSFNTRGIVIQKGRKKMQQ